MVQTLCRGVARNDLTGIVRKGANGIWHIRFPCYPLIAGGGGAIHINSHINCPNYTGLKPKDFSSWVLQNRPS